ncbi:hypothetical protein OMCYN_01750 [cyanobiont of Ornithocercus magnificus]|nr:hypothetical protein OMCYN_01750 [cyanobiont of Ornithocercus magnificus]
MNAAQYVKYRGILAIRASRLISKGKINFTKTVGGYRYGINLVVADAKFLNSLDQRQAKAHKSPIFAKQSVP